MKELARRTNKLVQSDIRAITSMVKGLDGINLGQGICDMPVPDAVKQAMHRAVDEEPSIYTHFAGIEMLRSAIREKAERYNGLPSTSDDEVMVSVGSTGAFVAALFALLDPGDEVILFEPFYGYHRHLISLAGATPVFVSTEGDEWNVDFSALQRAITPRTKAVVVCTPANPSGKVWTLSELERLLSILRDYDLYAITDEIYEYMVYDGRSHVSLASLPDAYERTITISGFSKTFNMTGWRLGYSVGPAHLIEKMGLLNDLFYICAPAPQQYAMADVLPMEPAYYEELILSYGEKRRLMCETLEACGFGVAWPQGAYYVMADISLLGSGFENEAPAETLIQRAGVAAVPGASFFEHPEAGARYLRFCFAKEMDVLNDACRRLRKAFV